MLLWKVRSRQVCKKPYRPKIDFIPQHATEAHQRKTYIKLTQSWRLNTLPHPQMDGPSCASSVTQTDSGGLLGKLYQTSVEAPCPLPSSVLCTSDRTDVLTGKGWGDPPRQCGRGWGGRGGGALRSNSEPSMAPWKALCDGPLPRCWDIRTGHEGPVSIQQDCIEVPPGARHCAQPGERLAGRAEDKTVVSGLQSAEPLASSCTD